MKGLPLSERRTASVGDMLVVAVLVAVASWLSLELTRSPSGIAAVWVANGFLVGWLVSRPTRVWPGYVVAGFVAGLVARELAGDTFFLALALCIANLIEVLLIAGIVRRRIPDISDPKNWLSLGRTATLSTVVACAVSGAIASVSAHFIAGTPFANFLVWYPAHVIGMVLVATLTLVAHREGIGLLGRRGRRLDFALTMLLIAVVLVAIFAQNSLPLLFLASPPLLWAAFRHRFAGVVGGIAIMAIISSCATAFGYGPALLAQTGDTGRTFVVQLFIGAACLMTFPVALLMAEYARLTARVRSSETHYRMLAEYSHDVVVRMRLDGRRLYVSPSARDVLGWEPGELLTSRWELVHPDDVAKQRNAMATLLANGVPTIATYRFRHKNGNYIWVEASARLIPSEARDGSMDIIYAGRDVSERVAAEQLLRSSQLELENLARVDSLTGLANRRQFDERLALALARSRRQHLPVALLCLDIDHFKQINDSLGHSAGDSVLQVFAERLGSCVRAGDLAARLGGDEFVVLVDDARSPQVAEDIARKLMGKMSQGVQVGEACIPVTISIGVAYATRATDESELMSSADKALYAAKDAGRNTYHLVVLD